MLMRPDDDRQHDHGSDENDYLPHDATLCRCSRQKYELCNKTAVTGLNNSTAPAGLDPYPVVLVGIHVPLAARIQTIARTNAITRSHLEAGL